ncbi:MAG: thiosulfate oxidation carrier complex protein SoxZ [Gammaproteobacteria bacterium]|nr:thiosulfate oxidation carrier complex protein SoxZ [Gammaproteobacteria bacterium]
MASIKIRAKQKGNITTVKCLMSHPMETGFRKNKKTGKLIPAHHIQEVTITHADKVVLSALWSGAISKNPYLSCKFSDAGKGDKVTVSWKDNKGKSNSVTAKIK